MAQKTEKKKSVLSEIVQYIVLILSVVTVSFLIQMYVLTTFEVRGTSMSPTLKDGDRVMMYRLKNIDRFDVVVIDSPDEVYEKDSSGQVIKNWFGQEQRRLYIKRIIGMPNDTLEYKNDVLYINGNAVDEPYLNISRQNAHNQGVNYMSDETLKQIIDYIKSTGTSLPKGNTTLKEIDGKWVIPDNYYFVLGDNRKNSKDSEEFGLVHHSLIKGVAVFRFWPFSNIGIAPFQ